MSDLGRNDAAGWLARLARLPVRTLLATALAGYAGLSIFALESESATFDETTHLGAGYSYWIKDDFRLNPEHPPLLKLLSALPLLLLEVNWPDVPSVWERGDQDAFGYHLLYLSGNDPDLLLGAARLGSMLWGALLIPAVYLVARRRFGPEAGLVALVLVSACPLLLSHGHYVTTDVIGAFFIFSTVAAFWELLHRPSLPAGAKTGLLFGCALLSKYSAVALAPLLAALVGAFALARRLGWATEPDPGRPPASSPWAARAWAVMALAATAYVCVWAAYGFRYGPSPDASYAFNWDELPAHGTALRQAVDAGRRWGVLPEPYLYGLARVDDHNNWGHGSFLLGEHSRTGWRGYFPFAFLVKTPLPALILIAWGVVAWVRRPAAERGRDLPWLLSALLLGALAVTSRINIGVRHIYPMYPFLYVLAGGAASGGLNRVARGLIGGCLALAVAEAALSAPHHLAYFNLPARALAEPRDLLVDSNLDWGQDLARLRRFMDERGIRSVKLSYFGTASPRQLGLAHEVLPGTNRYTRFEHEWVAATELNPGDWVAISATNLAGVYLEEELRYGEWFRRARPRHVVGRSILVYQVPEFAP